MQSRIEQHLYTLPLEQQGEYALMLYRTTGNKVYLNTARVSLNLSADRLQKLASHMACKVDKQALLLEGALPIKPELLDRYLDYFFYGGQVVPELLRISQFGMILKGVLRENINRGVSGVDFKRAFTSKILQQYYAPDMAKQVYALLSLGFGDYRQSFIKSFQSVYPDKKDNDLSLEQRRHKWLTMAHLILAASDQLQEPVNDPLLNWIPEYFQLRESTLLAEGDNVLLAKVGLSLLLTGNKQSELLDKIRIHMSKLPSSNAIGKPDLWCMLLLGWVDDYYPDPALYRIRKFKHKMPYVLEPAD